MSGRRFWTLLVLVGLAVTAWTAVAVNAGAAYGARTTGDEPHYLLTAVSLGEDGDLVTGDELDARAYHPFHEDRLWDQTRPLPDGRRVEPHDPLLPVLLTAPMAVGGWVAAKLTLAVFAGAVAMATAWVAVRRFGVPLAAAAVTVLAFSFGMPLSSYATQVYPEMPAALAVVLVVAALTGRLGRGGSTLWLAGVVALPWLSVKYAPVAVILAAGGAIVLWRQERRRAVIGAALVLVFAGATYLALHQVWYGGWTVYAAGDHFAEGGQLSVMGYEANYPGRAIRLLGLLVDRHFGLAAWAPVFLVGIPALAALAHARPRGWLVLVAPFAAGWLNATFVAQTMHGWWSPGRQVVVVVPLLVIAVAWWVAHARRVVPVLVALGAVGAWNWVWMVIEASTGRRTLVVDFFATSNPIYRLWSEVLPDGRVRSAYDVVGFVLWAVAMLALGLVGWRSVIAAGDTFSSAVASSVPNNDLKPMEEHTPCPGKQTVSVV
jgi:hypothetical protein